MADATYNFSKAIFFDLHNTYQGGALSFESISGLSLFQCLFKNVTSQSNGGAIHKTFGDLIVNHCCFDCVYSTKIINNDGGNVFLLESVNHFSSQDTVYILSGPEIATDSLFFSTGYLNLYSQNHDNYTNCNGNIDYGSCLGELNSKFSISFVNLYKCIAFRILAIFPKNQDDPGFVQHSNFIENECNYFFSSTPPLSYCYAFGNNIRRTIDEVGRATNSVDSSCYFDFSFSQAQVTGQTITENIKVTFSMETSAETYKQRVKICLCIFAHLTLSKLSW